MFCRSAVALVIVAVAAAAGRADEPVRVTGTPTAYEPVVTVRAGDKDVRLNLTGAGLRSKVGVRVYTVASYVQEGVTVRTAEDVVKADAVRVLHLVMQRKVEPAEFVGAFKTAVARAYPDDRFAAEFAQVVKAVGDNAAEKGDHVTLLSVPGEGVRIRLGKKVDVTVKNADFARALWEMYLGADPVSDALKASLTDRLKP